MAKILIIEDSALMRREMRRMLDKAGEWEIHTARNGQDGLEAIEKLNPDLVTAVQPFFCKSV